MINLKNKVGAPAEPSSNGATKTGEKVGHLADEGIDEIDDTLPNMPKTADLSPDSIEPKEIDPVPGRPQTTPSLSDKPKTSREKALAAAREKAKKALN